MKRIKIGITDSERWVHLMTRLQFGHLINKRSTAGTPAMGMHFAAPYTDVCDYIGFDGTYLKGREEIASLHQMLFDKFVKGSRLVGKIRSIRFLTSDIAIVVAVGGTVMVGQSDIDPERNSIHMLVAINQNANWRFTAFQNSRAQFIGRPEEAQALTNELRQLL
jgi:uncharacterized protein (TIGR02246 family)